MKSILHEGHQGIEITKLRARSSIYWPNINADITVLVNNYTNCLDYRNKQQHETLISHDVPTVPCSKVVLICYAISSTSYRGLPQ